MNLWVPNAYLSDATLGESSLLRAPTIMSVSDVPTENLAGWYKTDELSASGGDLITSVPDSGPGGNDLQADSGDEPEYIASALNGKPALYFDGFDRLYRNDCFGLSGDPALTVYVVIDVDNITRFMGFGVPSGNGGELIDLRSDAGAEVSYRFDNGNTVYGNVDLGAWGIGCFRKGAGEARSNHEYFQNGTAASVTGSVSGTTNISDTAYRAGDRMSAFENPLDGHMAEWLVYTTHHDDQTRQEIETYLNDKYAIF